MDYYLDSPSNSTLLLEAAIGNKSKKSAGSSKRFA